MTVKTHLYGRDKKEKLKELILDEHEECGCQCSDLAIKRCAGTFNERWVQGPLSHSHNLRRKVHAFSSLTICN